MLFIRCNSDYIMLYRTNSGMGMQPVLLSAWGRVPPIYDDPFSHVNSQGVPVVLVVTGISFMILDPKSLSLKYRVELKHLEQISVSSFNDHIFILHINPVSLSTLSTFPYTSNTNFEYYIATCIHVCAISAIYQYALTILHTVNLWSYYAVVYLYYFSFFFFYYSWNKYASHTPIVMNLQPS